MKFKHFSRKIIALVLAVVMLMPSALSTLASAQSADIGGLIQGGALKVSTDGTGSTAKVDAIRLTFIDAGNGSVVSDSVDWAISGNCSSGLYSFEKKCKTAYRNGEQLVQKPSFKFCPQNTWPTVKVNGVSIQKPRLDGSMNYETLRAYFSSDKVVDQLITSMGKSLYTGDGKILYDKFRQDQYDILIEPMCVYLHLNNIAYIATATEYAVLAKQQQEQGIPRNKTVVGTFGGAYLDSGLQSCLCIEGDYGDTIGYSGGIPPFDIHGSVYQHFFPVTCINSSVGVGLIYCNNPPPPPPTGEPQLITHTCYINYTPSR